MVRLDNTKHEKVTDLQKKGFKFLLGALLAMIMIFIIHGIFLAVQSSFFPVENLFHYLTQTNYQPEISGFYYDFQATHEDLVFRFEIPAENDAIMIKSGFEQNVTWSVVPFNPSSALHDSIGNIRLLPEKGWQMLDLRQMEKPTVILLELKKGGRLILNSTPLTGKLEYLKFFSRFSNLFSDQFVMIISGMSFLLAFIMFSIGRVNHELSKSYFALAVSLCYYGVLFFISGTFLNNEGYLYSMLQDTQGAFLFLNKLLTLLSIAFTVALFFGIEYFILKSWKYTKFLIFLNIIGFLLSLMGVPYMITVISFINFLFFAVIAYQSEFILFTFLAFVRPVGEIVNVFSNRLYSLYPFSFNEITFFIVFIGFGTFFIMDYNRKQREINDKNQELCASNQEILAMNQELESSYLEIEKLNNELEATVFKRTQQLQRSMYSMQTLLNNTDEGFMKFDASLIIEPEYSRECLSIFNASIDYHFFPALILSQTPEEIPFLTETLRAVINEPSDNKREILISLLPDLVNRQSKILSLKYRLIREKTFSEEISPDDFEKGFQERSKIMVMVRDISEKVKLKDRYEKEKELFEQIVKIMANSENFVELKEDYRQFWEEVAQMHAEPPEAAHTQPFPINQVFRSIHTLKGNFASFGFRLLVEKLHQLESTLKDHKEKAADILFNIIHSGEDTKWLDDEMQSVYEYISPQILERQIDLSKKRNSLVKIKELLSGTPSPDQLKEARTLLDEMEKTSFEDLFEPTKNLVLSTAQRLDIQIKSFDVKGANIFVDKHKLKPLLKTCIHLFRNILDHAIEDPEQRLESGKDPGATIKVHAYRKGSFLMIDITDDGRGIDRDLVFSKALEKGFLKGTSQECAPFHLEDIIFQEGFSTKDSPTDISGRGIGLSAVKNAVESLCGTIKIKTEKGLGTTFSIIIPEDLM